MKPRDRWAEDLVASAQRGRPWYTTDDGKAFEVAVDFGDSAYGVYSCTFGREGDGWSTFIWDISEADADTPTGSSPWDGWASWFGKDLLIAMRNDEHWVHEVHELPGRSPFVEDEGADDVEYPLEQWAELARIITRAQFQMLGDPPTQEGGDTPSMSE